MYDQLLARCAAALKGIPGIKKVLLGLEETGDTPCIRLWINAIQQPEQVQPRRYQREMVSVCAQVDTFPGSDRRAGYLKSLEAVGKVKARLESLRVMSKANTGLPLQSPTYQLLQMPESDAVVHVITCPFEAAVSLATGETEFNLPPLEE